MWLLWHGCKSTIRSGIFIHQMKPHPTTLGGSSFQNKQACLQRIKEKDTKKQIQNPPPLFNRIATRGFSLKWQSEANSRSKCLLTPTVASCRLRCRLQQQSNPIKWSLNAKTIRYKVTRVPSCCKSGCWKLELEGVASKEMPEGPGKWRKMRLFLCSSGDNGTEFETRL